MSEQTSPSTPAVVVVIGDGTIQEVASTGGRIRCRIIDLDTDTDAPHIVDWAATEVPDIEAYTRLILVLDRLTTTGAPVPPMLEQALGYTGEARFVGMAWSPQMDAAMLDDGRTLARGEWDGYLTYLRHPAVTPQLRHYQFGSSTQEPEHWLVLDRQEGIFYVVRADEAARVLANQWPHQEDDTPAPSPADHHAALVRPEEHERVVQAMRTWLDTKLSE